MSTNRKRSRSDDGFIVQQSKYFVNQKLVDTHDNEKMQNVYGNYTY